MFSSLNYMSPWVLRVILIVISCLLGLSFAIFAVASAYDAGPPFEASIENTGSSSLSARLDDATEEPVAASEDVRLESQLKGAHRLVILTAHKQPLRIEFLVDTRNEETDFSVEVSDAFYGPPTPE